MSPLNPIKDFVSIRISLINKHLSRLSSFIKKFQFSHSSPRTLIFSYYTHSTDDGDGDASTQVFIKCMYRLRNLR